MSVLGELRSILAMINSGWESETRDDQYMLEEVESRLMSLADALDVQD